MSIFDEHPTMDEFNRGLEQKVDKEWAHQKEGEFATRVEDLAASKADIAWVLRLEVSLSTHTGEISQLHHDFDSIASQLDEMRLLLQDLPNGFQECLGKALQDLCLTQFQALETLCAEKIDILSALETQTANHATAAAERLQELAAATQNSLELLRNQSNAIQLLAEQLHAAASGHLISVEEVAAKARHSMEQLVQETEAKTALDCQIRDQDAICVFKRHMAALDESFNQKQLRLDEQEQRMTAHTVVLAKFVRQAEDMERSFQDCWCQARSEAAVQLTAANRIIEEANLRVAEIHSTLAGCNTFWGRLRWLFSGVAQPKV